MSANEQPKFEEWAIVEVMGRVSIAGLVTEEQRFGTSMCRVDVPAVKDSPTYTRYFGGSSIYSITPCSEEAARVYVEQRVYAPPIPYEVRRQLTAVPDGERNDVTASEW